MIKCIISATTNSLEKELCSIVHTHAMHILQSTLRERERDKQINTVHVFEVGT
jgi:hypothetical protein